MLRELTRPIVRSWWTVVAGSCLGLAGAWLALGYLARAGGPLPGTFATASLGIVIGLILFAGLPLVRSAVDPQICTERSLHETSGLPTFGAIPRLRTRETAGEARRRLLVNLLLSSIAVGLLAAVLLAVGRP